MSEKATSTGSLAVHGGLFIAALALVFVVCPLLPWPWYLVLPLAVYSAIVAVCPPLRRTMPRIRVGRVGGAPLLAAIALAAVTALVLVTYDVLVRPDVAALAANLPAGAFGNIVLAGICFSIVNAVMEELIFRGVLYEALSAEWGVVMAITITTALFGLGHLGGYPPGPAGAVLAAGFGAAMGLLRWWTGGLGLAIACHIVADATIFLLLVSTLAFGESAF